MGREIITTDIDGLDMILGGGVLKGSTVLVTGPSGTGKTVLSLQYAFNQAKKGDRVLFISTCEPLYKINKYASGLSFYDLDLISAGLNMDYYASKEKRGYVEFQDYSLGQISDEQYPVDFFDSIQKKVARRSIDHIIIDSVSSINMMLSDEIERRKKILLFSAWVSRMGCTTILTSEQESDACNGTEKYLADAVIELGRPELGQLYGKNDLACIKCRAIEIIKVRGKGQMQGKFIYNISDEGIKVILPGQIQNKGKDNAAGTGIPDLDGLCGGIEYGEIWHFRISDPWCFIPMMGGMMQEAFNADDGLLCFISPEGHPLSLEKFIEIMGDNAEKAMKEGNIAIADIHGKNIPKDLKNNVIKFSIDDGHLEGIGRIKETIEKSERKWRIFINIREIESCYGTNASKKLFSCLSAIAQNKKCMLITFKDGNISNDLQSLIEPCSSCIIDIRDREGYTLLHVIKSAYAKIYGPLIIKEIRDKIRLLPL
jgi:circadian clock protein KaiC